MGSGANRRLGAMKSRLPTIIFVSGWIFGLGIYLAARDAHSINGEMLALAFAFGSQLIGGIAALGVEAVSELRAIRELLEANRSPENSN